MQANVMKSITGDQRASGGPRRLRRLTVLGAALAVLATGACGSGTTATPTAKAPAPKAAPAVLADDQYVENASAFVDAANWDKAPKVRVELNEMSFKPENVALEAGKPYVIELVNIGKVKHEVAATKFFRGSAIRKIETPESEVKAPFFKEIEVLPGKTAELFVIPVIPGSFPLVCEIKGHREAGMEGTVTVSGVKPAAPVAVLGSMKAAPWLQNGPALVEAAAATWDAKKDTVQIEAGESGATMFFKPKNTNLKVNVPAVIELKNVGKLKHEFTSEGLFTSVALRKAEDASGEYKAPMLKEAEVKAGKQLDLYVIPTKVGTFKIACEIPGHEKAGMFGTVTVTK